MYLLLDKKIDGISLRTLNKNLKQIAFSKSLLEKNVENNVLSVYLPIKKTGDFISETQKKELLSKIEALDGMTTLKLCILEDCKPNLKEKKSIFGIYRWLEFPLEKTNINQRKW
ncbi:MAG TPA: hypothetical protein VNR61_08340 [Niallia sp.]|nr:hypothetical protein [Niallia sp.]